MHQFKCGDLALVIRIANALYEGAQPGEIVTVVGLSIVIYSNKEILYEVRSFKGNGWATPDCLRPLPPYDETHAREEASEQLKESVG